MITPSFLPTATERVLPKLALDFTTASLDSRVTLTRALNTATCVNSSGLVSIVNANLPRFDYNPVTLACKGLLIEESRVNSITYSEDFYNAAWGKTGSSVTQDAAVSPDGNTTADKLIGTNGTTGRKAVSNSISTTSGTTYTFSVFLKKGEKSTATISFATANVSQGAYYGSNVLLDLNAGTSPSPSVVSLTSYGNGWYRAAVTGTMTATETTYFLITEGAVNGGDFTGNGIDGIYVWGAQVEVGAFPTSYIPNLATGTTTRNADVATMTGTNFSSWWTATTGAVSAWAIPKIITGTRPLIQFDDNTADNIIALRGNAANPELYIKATTDQAQIDAGTIVANTSYKITGAWNTNSCAAAQNGSAAVTDNSATIPTATQARVGSDGTNYANAWVQKIMYWPQRIANNEVQAFSK